MKTDIITRPMAIQFLSKKRTGEIERFWNGGEFSISKYKTPRNTRGPGGAVDLVNYGYFGRTGNLLAVARVGMAPYGNSPAIAAVGKDLAGFTVYLMRLAGIGLSHSDLVEFVISFTQRLHSDLPNRDVRYLLSLDDPQERLIEGDGFLRLSHAVTGKTYIEAGALHGGATKKRSHGGRYLTIDGEIRATYKNGKNITPEISAKGHRIISEGIKHRFIWVLAQPGSLQHAAWRRVLPANVTEPVWGKNGLGWVQPRLFARKFHSIDLAQNELSA